MRVQLTKNDETMHVTDVKLWWIRVTQLQEDVKVKNMKALDRQ